MGAPGGGELQAFEPQPGAGSAVADVILVPSIDRFSGKKKKTTTRFRGAFRGFHRLFPLLVFLSLVFFLVLFEYSTGVDPQRPHPNRILEVPLLGLLPGMVMLVRILNQNGS